MLFNSLEFVVFLLATLAIYHLGVPRSWWRARKAFLVVASYVFYMSFSPPFAVLLLASTVIDFALGLCMERATAPLARKALVVVSLAFNLGMLGYFKYGAFLAGALHGLLGVGPSPAYDILLPVGISFYTFESLSYTINVYRGEAACRSLLDFSLFLSFFPHLVAGPIVRPRQFLPQLDAAPAITGPQVEVALARIAQGFMKKVLLADVLGAYVDQVWCALDELPRGNVALAFYAYAFQIYFDFSGYVDIAIGLGQLFGLWLPENFDRPYLARNPREFWQRWHISLSTWLRDYLYVSLGGNRVSRGRTYVNLLLTMLLGGLWHGAAWNFVLWGGYHGVWLALHRAWSTVSRPASGTIRTAMACLVTFHLVCLGWVLFRAPDLAEAAIALRRLAAPGMIWMRSGTQAAVVVALGVLLHVLPPARVLRERFVALPPFVQGVAYASAAIAGLLLAPAGERFIYFQF